MDQILFHPRCQTRTGSASLFCGLMQHNTIDYIKKSYNYLFSPQHSLRQQYGLSVCSISSFVPLPRPLRLLVCLCVFLFFVCMCVPSCVSFLTAVYRNGSPIERRMLKKIVNKHKHASQPFRRLSLPGRPRLDSRLQWRGFIFLLSVGCRTALLTRLFVAASLSSVHTAAASCAAWWMGL